MIEDTTQCNGDIEMTIEWDDGRIEHYTFHNTVLKEGRKALAASLANSYGDNYDFFISRIKSAITNVIHEASVKQ